MDDRTSARTQPITVTAIGGPTLVLDIAGTRIVTDPTFDEPGHYAVGQRELTKTAAPALNRSEIGVVTAVLLSHDQHPDNLDHMGRELVRTAPLTLTTEVAARRLGGTARALPAWETHEIIRHDGGTIRITGVPAQHGPNGTEYLTGPVSGIVITGDDLPSVYLSGDNASLDIVEEIRRQIGPVDIAILFAGGAQTPLLGDAYLTLSSAQAAEAAKILEAARVVVAHTDGWAHFTDQTETVRPSFDAAGIGTLLVDTPPGVAVVL